MSNRLGVLALVLFAVPAAAEKKTVVLAMGDCADPSLVSAAKDFRDASTRLLREQLMEGDVVLDIVRPRATRSIADLERQIDSARTLFYGGQPDRASELVDRALEELERASPESRPWQATVNALILKALIAKGAERTRDMNDAFRRIARIDPTYRLDANAYPPSALQAFEAVKKEVVRGKKFPVLLRPETGSAMVFVDGQSFGLSPVTAMLLPGTYRVSMVSGSAVSFPHRVEIPRDLKLSVDLAFEGSIGLQPPLCLSGAAEGAAVKLAQLVAAERVVMLRNVAKKGEPPFLSGSVFDLATGRQEREGSVQPELIGNLATFLITGKEALGVQRLPPPPPPPPLVPVAKNDPEPAKQDEPKKEPDLEVAPALRAPIDGRGAPSPPAAGPSRAGAFVASGALAAAGLAAIGSGLGIYFAETAVQERTRLAGLTAANMFPLGDPAYLETLELMGSVDRTTNGAFALIAGGISAVSASIVSFVLFSTAPVRVALAPTRDGGVLGVSGKF